LQNLSSKDVMSNLGAGNYFCETIDECKKLLNSDANYFLKSKSVAETLERYMVGHPFYRELPKISGFVFMNSGNTLKLHIEFQSMKQAIEFHRSLS